MKQLVITIIFYSLILSSCNKNKQRTIEGKWRLDDTIKGLEIIFAKGYYNTTKWNDDLVNTSKGKYFFNENQARRSITLTLIPDLQYSEGGTIILPCEIIDIVSMTDSVLITQNSTQWIHGFGKGVTIRNFTEKFRKIYNK
jgi:hypothetical protein